MHKAAQSRRSGSKGPAGIKTSKGLSLRENADSTMRESAPPAGDFSAGAGDVLSLSGTYWYRRWRGMDSLVNKTGVGYLSGTAAGTAIGMTLASYFGGPNGVLSRSVLNHNPYARLGWSMFRGQRTFRFVVGSAAAAVHAHLDLYPKAAVPAVADFLEQLFR